MRYLEAPEFVDHDPSFVKIFLAGGITNCPDWQSTAALFFADYHNVTVMNPRRADFDLSDSNAAKQVHWEYEHLLIADVILFWFPADQVQPIALFELGRWTQIDEPKPVFVGVHEHYPRKIDVVFQLGLSRPEIHPLPSLRGVCQQVEEYLVEGKMIHE